MKALLHKFILLLITKPYLLLATSLGVFFILRFWFISDVEPLHINSLSHEKPLPINSVPDQEPLQVKSDDPSFIKKYRYYIAGVAFIWLAGWAFMLSDPVKRDALWQVISDIYDNISSEK